MSTPNAAEWVRIGDLLPWDRNPKAHPTENVAEIARSIVRFGFTEPIIPWRSRKQVVAGHGRLLAAQMLYREDPGRKLAPDQPGDAATRPEDGLVPVRWIEFLNDHEAAAYAIADNRLTEKNPMDAALVADIFIELDAADVSLEGLGYTGEELGLMLNPPQEPEPEEADTSQQVGELTYRLIVVCRNEIHQGELLERFEQEGLECQPLIS